jgi:hypothetical protein
VVYTALVKSRFRALAALLAAVAVLLSQLAVSAYACPGVDGMARAAITNEEVPPCHEVPTTDELAALCQAHCQQGDQSLEKRASVPEFTLVAGLAAVAIAPRNASRPAQACVETQPSLLERPTGPPLAVRHCRFRI